MPIVTSDIHAERLQSADAAEHGSNAGSGERARCAVVGMRREGDNKCRFSRDLHARNCQSDRTAVVVRASVSGTTTQRHDRTAIER